MRTLARAGTLLGIILSLTTAAHGQSGIQVELDEVVDNRINAGEWRGTLELRVNLKGAALDKASAARILVKEAKDDRGGVLSDGSAKPDFLSRQYNSGALQFSVSSPARAASSVKIKGTVELYVPTRDPGSVIKIEKALAKLDAPLNAKALKAAKITLTPLSPAGYAAAKKAQQLDEKQLADMRAEGKKRGVSDEEIEKALAMAKAFDGLDGDLPEGAVILSGSKADFDRIFLVEVLGADGAPIDMGSRSTSTRGESTVMTMQPSQPVPPNATLQLSLLTDKSRVTSPFEMSVPLP